MTLSEPLAMPFGERDVRMCSFCFSGVVGGGEGVVITISFQSPVEAPAPDSAVNHGRLMTHTRPIPTLDKHKPGDSLYSWRQGLLLHQTRRLICRAVWPLGSAAGGRKKPCLSLFAVFGQKGHSHIGHSSVRLTPLVI